MAAVYVTVDGKARLFSKERLDQPEPYYPVRARRLEREDDVAVFCSDHETCEVRSARYRDMAAPALRVVRELALKQHRYPYMPTVSFRILSHPAMPFHPGPDWCPDATFTPEKNEELQRHFNQVASCKPGPSPLIKGEVIEEP